MKKILLVFCLCVIATAAYASRDGAGTMSVPYSSFQPGTTISSSQVNTDISQIVSEITNSWPRDGQAAPTANMPMNGFKLTGLGNGSAATDSVNYGQLTAATTGIVTATSVNTFTNKTIDTAGAGNVLKINGQTVSAVSGNTTKVATISGALVNGDCVSIDGNGNLVDASAVCGGGGGSGTVNSGTAGQIAYYATSTTAVSSNANLSISTGAVTIGQAGSVAGTLKLSGVTSGTTTLAVASAASGTLTLPSATDTLVGKATTDTLTNKTFDTAGTGNSFLINGVAATANTGTGSVVRATSPTLATASLGSSTATTQAAGDNSTKLATTAYVDRGSSMTLLTTVNAGGSSTVSFNATYITSSYNTYLILFDSVVPGTNAQSFNLQVSSDNGGTWKASGYNYAGGYGSSTGAGADFGGEGQTQISLSGGLGATSTSTKVGAGQIRFSKPSASNVAVFDYEMSFFGSDSHRYKVTGTGSYETAGSINAIQIYTSSGTLSGNFHLYGISGL